MNHKFFSSLICIVFLFFTSISIAQTDFRNANWGMKGNAVKAIETQKLISEDAVRIIYECELGNIKGKVIYVFTNSDKLLRAKYLMTPEYTNFDFYIKDFKMFQDLLIEKYGKPKGEIPTAIGTQSIPEKELAAKLYSDDLRMETKWENPTTEIILTLSKIGDKPTIQIDYISKEIGALDLKEKKEKILKYL